MKYTYLLPFILLVSACGGEKATEEKNTPIKDSTAVTEVAVEDSAIPTPLKISVNNALLEQVKPEEKKLLLYFFGKTHAAQLLSVMGAIERVQTDADLHTCFHYADSVCGVASIRMNDDQEGLTGFYDHIDSINNLYDKIAHLLPYLEFGCEAECSMPVIDVKYTAFEKLAKTTKGQNDDDYFAFMREAHGEGGHPEIMSASWFSMTWDYGGNSMLGAGDHYKTLKLAQDIKTDNVFADEITFAQELCFKDALTYHTLFHTAEKAIGELKMIMKLDIGIQNKKKIEERIKALQNPDKDLQTDCEHHDCIYG